MPVSEQQLPQQHQFPLPQPQPHNHQTYPNEASKVLNLDSSSPSVKSTERFEDESKACNQRLLISLGMLLPALAAIIGVVAWAISAEVVMGARRESARHHPESALRLTNKFHYSKLNNGFVNHMPQKEMLVDPRFHDASIPSFDSLDFINHSSFEEIASHRMMRKMDDESDSSEVTAENGKKKQTRRQNKDNFSSLLSQKRTPENLAKLIEKLLSDHNVKKRNKAPKIVVVAPAAANTQSGTKKKKKDNVTKPSIIQTKVATTKPKEFNLKIAPAKKNEKAKVSVIEQAKRKSAVDQNKKQHLTSSKNNRHEPKPTKASNVVSQTKQSTPPPKSNGKNFKTKIYEKEIDLLLQKIEKLEKQQNIKHNEKSAIPEKFVHSELIKGKPFDIADKIKSFLSGSGPSANEERDNANDEQRQSMPPPPPPPMPPPMPPMPFMPFMPPMQQQADQQSTAYQYPPPQPPPPPPQSYQYSEPPREQMQMEPRYQYRQTPSAEQMRPSDYGHHYSHQPSHQNDNYDQQDDATPGQYEYQHNQYKQNSHPNYNQQQSHSPEMNSNEIRPHQTSNQPIGPVESAIIAAEESSNKRRRGGFFGGKFKIRNLLNSIRPKSKKTKRPENIVKYESDNRNIVVGNGGPVIDPMMMQESHMHPSYVDRGQYAAESQGFSMNLGGGPMGGGGQIKASPMGILKSIVLPFAGFPKWINGKVVLGIVLENGIGKKPKTVFQHFSTGRI